MRNMSMAIGLALAVVASLAAQAGPGTAGRPAASWTPPRAADGHADLSGVWANNSVTPLERPKQWEGKDHLTDAELEQLKRDISRVYDDGADAIFQNVVVAALEKRKLTSYDPTTGNYNQFWMAERDVDNRTSLITDPPNGHLPPLTPEAQKRRDRRIPGVVNEGGPAGPPANGPEDRPLSERCITFGAPRTQSNYNSYFQILQTPTMVGILQETIHDIRMVPVDGRPHLASSVRQWLGDSRGHWDGDTLVVETTNFRAKAAPFGATETLTTVERFTRVSPDYIAWDITVNDPATWTRPWTMMIRLKKDAHEIYEYACHENNYSMAGILAGARAQERAAAQKSGSR